jgi:hypothetical protein
VNLQAIIFNRINQLLFAVLSATLLAVPAIADEETDLDDVQEEWAEAVGSIKDYSVGQRDAAVEKAGDTLAAMDKSIEQLEQRTVDEWDDLSEEARETRLETLRTLTEKRNELAEWYGGMKYSSSQAWGEVKQGFAEAYDVLAEAWGDALDEFDD